MEPTEMPPLWALDMTAKAVDLACWSYVTANFGSNHSACKSIIAHARTLAKYETPPVDPAELKRWQDAREAAARHYEQFACPRMAAVCRAGEVDDDQTVQSAYIALCHRDGVEPQDKAPGGVA